MKPDRLAQFSTDELLAEIVRRRNAPKRNRTPRRWCHDCANFVTNPHADDRYNPCKKGHTMKFRVPEDHQSPESGGFYLPCCPDRTPTPEPPK